MTHYQLADLLKEKRIIDALQFFSSCQFKIEMMDANKALLEQILADFWNEGEQSQKRISQELIERGTSLILSEDDSIELLGVRYSRGFILNKSLIEMYGTLHSFFDIYAQWLNRMLLADEAIPIERVSISSVNRMLQTKNHFKTQYPDFLELIDKITSSADYQYIADMNNTLKHRQVLISKAKFDLFSGDFSGSLPPFEKDGRTYTRTEIIDQLQSHVGYCKNLINDSCIFAELFYMTSNSLNTENRFHNPNIQIIRKADKSIHSIMPYIEDSVLRGEYHFLLCYFVEETETVQIFNCPYEMIAVFKPATQICIGLLIPSDTDIYSLDDGRVVHYRKYVPKVLDADMIPFELGIESTRAKKIYPLLAEKIDYIKLLA